MSLHHIAKHLEAQGRGPDTMLVHMAPNEVHALNEFAKAHGTHLTVNPKTGLPEAGILSTLLGAGIFAFTGWDPMLIAAGVGAADAAVTGSLGQGLMAGLGAWGGAGLAGNISSLASADAIKNASDVTNISDLAQNTAKTLPESEVGMFNQFPNAVSGGTGVDAGLNNIPMTSGNVGMANSFPSTMGGSGPAASFSSPMSNVDLGQNFNRFSEGASKLVEHPWDSVKQIWNNPATDALPSGKSSLITAGMTAAPYIIDAFRPDPYKAPEQEKNPFGLKSLSKDFQGSFPTKPNPYYQAQYRDYVANPYQPTPTLAARGGLQSYASGDLIKYGLSLINQKQEQAPIVPSDPGNAYGGPGVMEYEKEYEGMSPTQRTHARMQSLFGKKTAIKPVGSLGAISTDPAIVSLQAIEDEKQKQAQSSKEGGLMHYALGGLSVGHLGGYSDGGRLLKGPGDGVSDSIPASIGNKQPARLAEGEFVIPARIVSELGNGSTDAGAKRLYAMMDRIKARRRKAKDIAADTKAYNLLPA